MIPPEARANMLASVVCRLENAIQELENEDSMLREQLNSSMEANQVIAREAQDLRVQLEEMRARLAWKENDAGDEIQGTAPTDDPFQPEPGVEGEIPEELRDLDDGDGTFGDPEEMGE